MAARINPEISGLLKAQRDLPRQIRTAMKRALTHSGRDVVEYLQSHHPWTTRSGATDEQTTFEVVPVREGGVEDYQLRVTVGTDYARFLEYKNNGKFAWFHKGVVETLPVVLNHLREAGYQGAFEASAFVAHMPDEGAGLVNEF